MKQNFILMTDAYKETHWKQYPADTEYVYSYLESRGGRSDYTVFFGLQYFLEKYLKGRVIEQWMIDEADDVCRDVFGTDTYFNVAGWQYILDKYDGKLPVSIMAPPEGLKIPTRNALVTIVNTDPKVPWLTNFLESLLLQIWYPISVATLSANIKDIIGKYANETSDVGVSPFHLNDFGFRGVSSPESAGIGGMSHLTSFLGTDTLQGIMYAKRYYGPTGPCGHSVMATEHSTTTIYTRDKEIEAYKTFLKACPSGILSVVIDSYDPYAVIDMFGTILKDEVLAREGTVVFRPDSGDPVLMSIEIIELLDKYFGHTYNSKGKRVLNPKVKVIYGDGINYDSIQQILWNVTMRGYSTDNIVFGMGGGLLQQVNRDTHKFAFKCCAARRNGEWIDVYKDPVTDKGKGSKRGRLRLIRTPSGYETIPHDADVSPEFDILREVFLNGDIKQTYTFDQVKENLAQ